MSETGGQERPARGRRRGGRWWRWPGTALILLVEAILFIVVIGPAGIGKSTIAAEFARVTEAQGARVVFGRSLPYRESGTYGALAGQLMTLSDVFESDPVPPEKRHSPSTVMEASGPVETLASNVP